MPKTITQRATSPATERLARAALELHRLALTAAEVQHLPSPLAHREQTSKRGAQDPTATTALDERRAAVAEALALVEAEAKGFAVPALLEHAARLRNALNAWDGRR